MNTGDPEAALYSGGTTGTEDPNLAVPGGLSDPPGTYGEPVAVRVARRVREAVRGNGPVERPEPRPGPTSQHAPAASSVASTPARRRHSPRSPQQPSGRCDETYSAASYTSTCRMLLTCWSVDQAAGSAAHSVPRATVGWLGMFLATSRVGSDIGAAGRRPPAAWLNRGVIRPEARLPAAGLPITRDRKQPRSPSGSTPTRARSPWSPCRTAAISVPRSGSRSTATPPPGSEPGPSSGRNGSGRSRRRRSRPWRRSGPGRRTCRGRRSGCCVRQRRSSLPALIGSWLRQW